LPENNKRVRYLLDEEEPKLFAILNGRRKHLRPLVTVAIGTGMRRGDQLNLQWEKVDFQQLSHLPQRSSSLSSPKKVVDRIYKIVKSRVFASVDICCYSATASFYLFLPQFCHNEMGQGFLIVTYVRQQALPKTAAKYEQGSRL
jgi:integrase